MRPSGGEAAVPPMSSPVRYERRGARARGRRGRSLRTTATIAAANVTGSCVATPNRNCSTSWARAKAALPPWRDPDAGVRERSRRHDSDDGPRVGSRAPTRCAPSGELAPRPRPARSGPPGPAAAHCRRDRVRNPAGRPAAVSVPDESLRAARLSRPMHTPVACHGIATIRAARRSRFPAGHRVPSHHLPPRGGRPAGNRAVQHLIHASWSPSRSAHSAASSSAGNDCLDSLVAVESIYALSRSQRVRDSETSQPTPASRYRARWRPPAPCPPTWAFPVAVRVPGPLDDAGAAGWTALINAASSVAGLWWEGRSSAPVLTAGRGASTTGSCVH